MLTPAVTQKIINYFYSSSPFQFIVQAQAFTHLHPKETLALPLMWLVQTHSKSILSAVDVTFVLNSRALFGFHISNIVIHDQKELFQILTTSGRDFSHRHGVTDFKNLIDSIVHELESMLTFSCISVEKCLEKLYEEIFCLKKTDYSHYEHLQRDALLEVSLKAKKTLKNDLDDTQYKHSINASSKPNRISLKSFTAYDLYRKGDETVKDLLKQCAWIDKAYSNEVNNKKAQRVMEKDQPFEFPSPIKLQAKYFLMALAGSVSFYTQLSKSLGLPLFLFNFPQYIIEGRASLLRIADKRTGFNKHLNMSTNWYDLAEMRIDDIQFSKPVETFLDYLLIYDSISDKIVLQSQDLEATLYGLKAQISTPQIGKHYQYLFDFINDNKQRVARVSKEKYSALSVINKTLNNTIIGQTAVANQLSAYISSLFFETSVKHLGISTFLGVSGTGKTQTAKCLQQLINKELSLNFGFIHMRMEQNVDSEDVLKLWGSGSQYVDSKIGELTQAVMHNPRQIILFDEIDKAHPNVAQSLLSLLDDGVGYDRTLHREINFSHCLFIFTTNLGSEDLDALPKDINLDLSKLLVTKRASNRNILSPELVNRMSAGGLMLFKKITAKDLINIAEAKVNTESHDTEITWRCDLVELVVRTLAGKTTPRAIQNQIKYIRGQIAITIANQLEVNQLNNVEKIIVDIEPALSYQQPNITIISDKACLNLENIFTHKVISFEDFVTHNAANYSCSDLIIIDESSISIDIKPFAKRFTKFEDTLIISFGFLSSPSQLTDVLSNSVLHKYICSDSDKNYSSFEELLYLAVNRYNLVTQLTEQLETALDVSFDLEVISKGNIVNVNINNLCFIQPTCLKDLDLPFVKVQDSSSASFIDIIGLEETKKRLSLIVNWMKNYDITKKRQVEIPRGYLLTGSPGTGKTQMARSVAGETNATFLQVNGADLLSGDPIRNINALFEYAQRVAPTILFIDEIDSIAKSRSTGAILYTAALNSLLTALDGFKQHAKPVFVLAATNHPEEIDAALLRPGRLEKIITFSSPDSQGRKQYLELRLNHQQIPITTKQLQELVSCTRGFTIADIDKLIREASYRAIENQGTWGFREIIYQIREKRFGPLVSKVNLSEECRRKTAYHEAGHLVVSKILSPNSPIEFVSIEPTEYSLGMMVIEDNLSGHENGFSRGQVKQQIQIALGGLAAETLLGLVGDNLETGAIQDRILANKLAKKAIFEWGLSDRQGLLMPQVIPIHKDDLIDEVAEWLNVAFEKSIQLLKSHKILLDYFCDYLLKHGHIDKYDIDKTIQNYSK
jgi:cell division protease FtsH